jgi:hypothetical protein
MKCYNHSEVEAVGFCRVCGRALCRECVTEVSGICCCKSRCEASVKTPEQYQAELAQHRAGVKETAEGFVRTVFRFMVTMSAILLLVVGVALKSPPDDANALGNLLILIAAILLARSFYLRFIAKRGQKDATPPVLPRV